MKKLISLCCLLAIIINARAQITNDYNWEIVLDEEFNGNRSWNSQWQDMDVNIQGYQPRWICYAMNSWNDGVTLSSFTNHAYQAANATFENGRLKLKSEWRSDTPLWCGSGYVPAPGRVCNDMGNQHKCIFYHSGTIESISPFRYGYFEIKCKFPFHLGSFPAFWLFGGGNSVTGQYYEEIDIAEYSVKIGDYTPNKISHGLLFDPSQSVCPPVQSCFGDVVSFPNQGTITQWHTYGCEWLPGRITWYLDGHIIDEFIDLDSVPSHPLRILANYSIGNDAVFGRYPEQTPIWRDSDSMVVDYIRVYQLKCDCNTDVVITDDSGLANFDHRVKNSVEIGSTDGINALPSANITIRACDHITITGPFEVPLGAQFGMAVHPCPYPGD